MLLQLGLRLPRAHCVGEGFERAQQILLRLRQEMDRAAGRRDDAGLVGIGEERHRRRRADQDDVGEMLQPLDRLIDRIGNALDRHEPGAALDPSDRIGREELAPGLGRDAAGDGEARAQQRRAGEHDRGRPAVAQQRGGAIDRALRHGSRRRHGNRRGGAAALVPRGVGGQNEGRDLARRGPGGGDGLGAVARHVLRARRGAQELGIGPRDALDVGVERRVILLVIGRVVADHVDDGRARAACVVEIGEAVAEARRQMQQGRGGLAQHAAIAVGRARHHALEERQDAAYALDPVERRDEMHLRRAGIGEARARRRLPRACAPGFPLRSRDASLISARDVMRRGAKIKEPVA